MHDKWNDDNAKWPPILQSEVAFIPGAIAYTVDVNALAKYFSRKKTKLSYEKTSLIVRTTSVSQTEDANTLNNFLD